MDIVPASSAIELANVQAQTHVSVLRQVLQIRQDMAMKILAKHAQFSMQIQKSQNNSHFVNVKV